MEPKQPKPTKTGRLTLRKLGVLVDQLGELRDRKGDIEAPERDLTEQITAALDLLKLPSADGKRYTAAIDECRWLEIDLTKFLAKFGEAALKSCCFVSTKKARAAFPDVDLDRLGERVPHPKLRVSLRPGTKKAGP
jgi:hypothetical protein